jgi:hypothetical protein
LLDCDTSDAGHPPSEADDAAGKLKLDDSSFVTVFMDFLDTSR